MKNEAIVYGDIHGCYNAATRAMELAEELQVPAIFLGDYVDRGPSGIKLLQALMLAKAKHPDWVFLMGNHEQMLMDLIEGRNKPEDIGIVTISGDKFDYAQSEHTYNEWKNLNGEDQRAVVELIEATKLFHETQHLIFTHAVLRETGHSIDEKSKEELLWNYKYEPRWPGKRFVHGHMNTNQINLDDKGININTACGYGGYLTGLLISMETARPTKLFSISEGGVLWNRADIQVKENN